MKPVAPSLRDMLAREFGESVALDEPMSRHTRFELGGPADVLFTPRDGQDLSRFLKALSSEEVPLAVIGMGSNLLVLDGGIRGVVISMTRAFRQVQWRPSPGEPVLHLGSGVPTDEAVSFCIEKAIAGLEFGTGIPGNIGGAVCMNAGTREGDVSQVISRVELMDATGERFEMKREEIRFEYRRAFLPEGAIVTGADFRLHIGDPEEIRQKVGLLREWRKQSQPGDTPCAGSVFKNPAESPAGRLIDQVGLKGHRIGGAAISTVHTNFIVNEAGARARDVLDLVEYVRKVVLEEKGVLLETEIKILGEDGDAGSG